jgi:hypothetical protein
LNAVWNCNEALQAELAADPDIRAACMEGRDVADVDAVVRPERPLLVRVQHRHLVPDAAEPDAALRIGDRIHDARRRTGLARGFRRQVAP